jgi:multiple antibiotic resistance protein
VYTEILRSFIILFVVINPIGNLTIFIGLAKGISSEKRLYIVNHTMFIASILLFVFLFFGLQIFELFKISLSSFMIAGGIILLLIAIIYVLDIHTRKHPGVENNLAAVPMATPLLIGPGVITSTIILVNENGVFITLVAAILALLSVWFLLRFSNRLYKFLGAQWSGVLSRVMGLILAAIAIEFIKDGMLSIITGA